MTQEKSDHFDGRRFVNPAGAAGQPFSAVARMLLEPRTRWPARIREPSQRPPVMDGAAAIITFIGHSTFLIQTATGNILTDPMYSERASPISVIGPRRVRPPAVALDDLPPISTVLLSHNHYDHCACSSESHGSRKLVAHRSGSRARDAEHSSRLPGQCEGDSFPTPAEVSVVRPARLTLRAWSCLLSSAQSNLSTPRPKVSPPAPADAAHALIVSLHANPRGPVRPLDRDGQKPSPFSSAK